MESPLSYASDFGGRRAIWLLALAVGSHAQLAEVILQPSCNSSELPGFDYKVEPEPGFSLHWSLTPFDEVSFRAVSTNPDVGWLGIGFSSDGNMVGSDAVVGSLGDESVLEWDLGSKNPILQTEPTVENYIGLSPDQELTGTSLQRVGNDTVLSFTRPLYPKGSGKLALFSEIAPVTLLWAAGKAATFSFHTIGMGAFEVDLLCADAQFAGGDLQPDQPEEIQPGTQIPTVAPTTLLFTFSPTGAPTLPFLPGPLSEDSTNGAITSRLLQGRRDALGLGLGFLQVVSFGVLATGASLASARL